MSRQREQDPDERVRYPFPPVPLPSAVELLEAAEASVALREIREFVTGLDGGRPPADTLASHWAEVCKLVQTVDGVQVPVEENASLLGEPLALWERAFGEYEMMAPYLTARAGEEPSLFALHFLDLMAAARFNLYNAAGVPMPVDLLHRALVRDLPLDVDGGKGTWRDELDTAVGVLVRLGAIELTQLTDPDELDRLVRTTGTTTPVPALISLTPIGLWAMNNLLRLGGMNAPIIGELAGADLGALHAHIAQLDSTATGTAELDAWVAHRSEATAAAEAGDFLRRADTPRARLFAQLILTKTGEHGVPVARSVRADGGLPGAAAASWLLGQGTLDESGLPAEEVALGMVDEYAALDELGALFDGLLARSLDEQLALVSVLAGTEHPSRLKLLEKIGREHPDNRVAKRARKVRFSLRSSGR